MRHTSNRQLLELPTSQKLQNTLIAQRTMEAMKQSLDPKQLGYMKGVSTSQCLIDILRTLHEHAEIPGSILSMMLTDFSKAFDYIDHTVAISKFLQMGVDSSLVSWISDFISNCEQCVKFTDKVSD